MACTMGEAVTRGFPVRVAYVRGAPDHDPAGTVKERRLRMLRVQTQRLASLRLAGFAGQRAGLTSWSHVCPRAGSVLSRIRR